MTQAMDCFQLDEAVTDKNRDEKEKIREKKRADSKQAQALALTLASRIDTLAEKTEKPKHQNGYEFLHFNITGCLRFKDICKIDGVMKTI